ncbi:uncharacterized protein LOC143834905 isoform X2 [Paroedura picta]|uniref:uncharacterized protein LOC143834905 isoform X2 n=1 Tax=Paroedura picta TaxID=143630 RepID=UPI004055A29B
MDGLRQGRDWSGIPGFVSHHLTEPFNNGNDRRRATGVSGLPDPPPCYDHHLLHHDESLEALLTPLMSCAVSMDKSIVKETIKILQSVFDRIDIKKYSSLCIGPIPTAVLQHFNDIRQQAALWVLQWDCEESVASAALARLLRNCRHQISRRLLQRP